MPAAPQKNAAVSAAVRALTELPAEQQDIYRARYLSEESREATCKRLSIDQGAYDARLASALRSLRRMAMSELEVSHG